MYRMNAKQRVEVKSTEYKVVYVHDPVVLYTKNLDDEVVCTIFSYQTGISALLRQVDITQLPQVMQRLNPNNLQSPDLFKVQLIRGSGYNDITEKYVSDFIIALTTLYNVTHNNIQEYNFDSLEFDCASGLVDFLGQDAIYCYERYTPDYT